MAVTDDFKKAIDDYKQAATHHVLLLVVIVGAAIYLEAKRGGKRGRSLL